MGVFNHPLSEGADAQLDHGSVVQDLHGKNGTKSRLFPFSSGRVFGGLEVTDLHGGVGVLDVVLQVAHEHQVAGLVPARVEGVVVDVAQDGAGPDTVGAVLGVDELAEAVHDDGAVLAFALLLVLLRLNASQP